MSRMAPNVVPGGILNQKGKYFVMKVIKSSIHHWVSCQFFGKNQSFVLLMQKLSGELTIKCDNLARQDLPIFIYFIVQIGFLIAVGDSRR